VLFKELIEQHRVHLVVAHGVWFSFLVRHHQSGVDLFNFLGDEAKLLDALGINSFLIAEGNRFKSEDRLAGFVDRFDLVLETRRRDCHAKETVG